MSSTQLHTLIDPAPIDDLGSWAPHLTQFDSVVGYSVLGHVFLWSAKSGNYAVLYPFEKSLKQYGEFDSVEAFKATVLDDPAFIDHAMPTRYIEAIAEHVERLSASEVYIPQPYPILGGSMQPDTYAKGNFWVFIDMVGQSHGL